MARHSKMEKNEQQPQENKDTTVVSSTTTQEDIVDTTLSTDQEKEEEQIASEALDSSISTTESNDGDTPIVPNMSQDILDAVMMDSIPAKSDPKRDIKLKAGWAVITEELPMFNPSAAYEFAKSYDPRTCSVDISHSINLPFNKIQKDVPAKPEPPTKVKGTPFSVRREWVAFAPEVNQELSFGYSLKMRQSKLVGASMYSKRQFEKNLFMASTEESPSYKFFIKTGVVYDNALLKKPYILRSNPEMVYGHSIKGVHYDHGMEIVDQRVFDIDGEMAILIRFTGNVNIANSKQEQPIILSADDNIYIADIQFFSDPESR